VMFLMVLEIMLTKIVRPVKLGSEFAEHYFHSMTGI
jgi:hypothetical protein